MWGKGFAAKTIKKERGGREEGRKGGGEEGRRGGGEEEKNGEEGGLTSNDR